MNAPPKGKAGRSDTGAARAAVAIGGGGAEQQRALDVGERGAGVVRLGQSHRAEARVVAAVGARTYEYAGHVALLALVQQGVVAERAHVTLPRAPVAFAFALALGRRGGGSRRPRLLHARPLTRIDVAVEAARFCNQLFIANF